MPLLVHCPQGCQIRVPVNRAGRVVRCPNCKSPIRIAQVDLTALATGDLIPCSARLARRRTPEERADRPDPSAPPADRDSVIQATGNLQQVDVQSEEIDAARRESSKSRPEYPEIHRTIPEPEPIQPPSAEALANIDPEIQRVIQGPKRVPPALQSRPWRNIQRLTTVQPDRDIRPIDIDIQRDPEPPAAPAVPRSPAPPAGKSTDGPAANTTPPADRASALPVQPSVSGLPTIDLNGGQSGRIDSEDRKNWRDRLQDANADRRVLARILAFFLLLVAVVNIAPAVYHWRSWAVLGDTVPLPRWIYLQLFVGAIYLIYSVFLAQIPDWSALRSVSVALLVMAFGFGVVSTGLLIGRSGTMAEMLGIPFALNQEAGIWCVAMLCLATLMSYWAGKESANWQRAEQMLREILHPPTGH